MTFKKFLSFFCLCLVARSEEGRGGDPRTVAECRHDFEFGSVVSCETMDTNIKRT